MFSKMATTLKGHFHSYNTLSLKHQADSITPPEYKVSIQINVATVVQVLLTSNAFVP